MIKNLLLFTSLISITNLILCNNEVLFSPPDELCCVGDLGEINVLHRKNNFYVVSKEKEQIIKKYNTDSILKSLNSEQIKNFKKNCYLKIKRDEFGEYHLESKVPLPSTFNHIDNDLNLSTSLQEQIPEVVKSTAKIAGGTGFLYFLSKTHFKNTFIGNEKEINSPHYKYKMAGRAASVVVGGIVGVACPPLGVAAWFSAWIAADIAHAAADGGEIFKDD